MACTGRNPPGISVIAELKASLQVWNGILVFPRRAMANALFFALIQSAIDNATVPLPDGSSSAVSVCSAVGHEGVHMAIGEGHGEDVPDRLQGSCRYQ